MTRPQSSPHEACMKLSSLRRSSLTWTVNSERKLWVRSFFSSKSTRKTPCLETSKDWLISKPLLENPDTEDVFLATNSTKLTKKPKNPLRAIMRKSLFSPEALPSPVFLKKKRSTSLSKISATNSALTSWTVRRTITSMLKGSRKSPSSSSNRQKWWAESLRRTEICGTLTR